jgi:hypothetical protein
MGMGRRHRRGGSILGKIHDYVKSNRLISKGLHHLSKHITHPHLHKLATVARNFSATQGYGRRRRRRPVAHMTGMGRYHKHAGYGPGIMTGMGRKRRRRGGNVFEKIGEFLKKHKVLSTLGKAISSSGIAGTFNPLVEGATKFAESHGYGRRHHIHPRHHIGTGLRHHSHHRHGGNNPYPTTNSFYGRPVF